MLPDAVVDAHHHLWDLSRGRYPWLQEAYDADRFILGDYRALCRDYLPHDLRADWQGVNVVATVHVEAERARDEALAETQWLQAMSHVHGLPHAIVAWVDLLADDARERLHEQAACTLVRAVRFKPATAPDAQARCDGPRSLHDPRWPAALARLADTGLAWDLRVPFWHLDEAAAVVSRCPQLPVAVEHTGLPWDRSGRGLARWRHGLQALAACPNVHLKLSEFGLKDVPWDRAGNLEVVRIALEVFGPRRCMFGSNFPVARLRTGYRDLVGLVGEALERFSPAERRAVWHDNARAFYRLEAQGDLS